jgi:ribonuclease P protein component
LEKVERYCLKKYEKVRKRKEFERIRRFGDKRQTKHFLLSYYDHRDGGRRLGIAVSRRVGNAVVRNRIKRYIREFFRTNKNVFRENLDICITAKIGAETLGYFQTVEELLFGAKLLQHGKPRKHQT